MSTPPHSPRIQRSILVIGVVSQLCLLLLLSWFSSDQSAHHRLHHFLDAVCHMCGHEVEENSDHQPMDQHGDDDDTDYSIALFANGHANPETFPLVVIAPQQTLLFLKDAPASPDFPPSRHLLPFACGPPSQVISWLSDARIRPGVQRYCDPASTLFKTSFEPRCLRLKRS